MKTASLTDAATVDAIKACLLDSSTQLHGWLPRDLLPPALDEFIASANAAPWHRYTDNGERGALAYLSITPWDESFFRLKMAEVHFLGDHSLGGTTALLSAALQAAQSCGVEHLRVWLPSSSDALRKGLAPLGFKPAWEGCAEHWQ